MLSVELVDVVARQIDPAAFSGVMRKIGCGSFWHYESHSSHSDCPSCGGASWANGRTLQEREIKAQERARATARNVLEAITAYEVIA